MEVIQLFDVKTAPWGSGKRVGTLKVFGGFRSMFTWSWIGISGGSESGVGMWMWDSAASAYHADLTKGEDPGSMDFFGELRDSWTVPQQGSAPTMPWDRTAHFSGELDIYSQGGAKTTYEWHLM